MNCLDPTSWRQFYNFKKHKEPAVEQVLLMMAIRHLSVVYSAEHALQQHLLGLM